MDIIGCYKIIDEIGRGLWEAGISFIKIILWSAAQRPH